MAKRMTYLGVNELRVNPTAVERHTEALEQDGYTLLSGVVSEPELVEARERLEEIYARQCQEFGGEEKLHAIGDVHKARGLLTYDPLFLHLSAAPAVLELLRATLGQYFHIVSQNGNINPRGTESERIDYGWHRDLTYQHFVSSRPVMMTALFCLDEFTPESGATWVCPASHRSEPCPSEEYLDAHQIQIEAAAGSVLIFDGMLFHRSAPNQSIPRRRAFNTLYGLPFFKQVVSLPAALAGRHQDDPVLRRLCGYESAPVSSVLEWRNRALERLSSPDPELRKLQPQNRSRVGVSGS